MVLLIFKIHCLIATAFKEKALKIVILQILSAFNIFHKIFLLSIISRASPALPPVSGCVVAGGVVFPWPPPLFAGGVVFPWSPPLFAGGVVFPWPPPLFAGGVVFPWPPPLFAGGVVFP